MAKVTKAKSEGSVFDELFGLLEKEVGGSDRESTVTQFLDTGFAPLNKIISGRYDGGFPVGRIVEISGASSSGKCLTGGTYTLGEKGMLTVDELFKSENFAPNCKQKTAEISVALINENNVLENTSHFVCNGRRKIKRIISSSGRIIEATYNHPIRVMTKEGLIVWKKSGHISVGDTLPVLRGSMQFGRGDLTVNEATFLGYMIADGCLSSHHRVAFSNSDAEIEKEFKRIAWDVFGVEFHTRKHKGSVDHILNNKTFRASLCEKYDLEYVKAAGKKVPLCVRTSNKDVMKEFIRAYMECGCHVYENGIEVTSASETLIRQVQLMLLNFGVYSSIQPKTATSYDQTYWRLHITGANADRYNEAIGFKTKNRLVRVESSKGRTYNDMVPNMGLIIKTLCLSCDTDLEIKRIIGHIDGDKSYETLAAIWEYFDKRRTTFNTNLLDYLRLIIDREYIYETVVDVEEDYQPTFDVSIPETHSF